MSYGQYKNGGRSLGRILYQLDKIHIPLRITESVVLVSNNQLQYSGKNFAEITWTDEDVPVFKFCEEYKSFSDLQNVYGGLVNHHEKNDVTTVVSEHLKTIRFKTDKYDIRIRLTNERVIVESQIENYGTLMPSLPDALIFVGKMMKESENMGY